MVSRSDRNDAIMKALKKRGFYPDDLPSLVNGKRITMDDGKWYLDDELIHIDRESDGATEDD